MRLVTLVLCGLFFVTAAAGAQDKTDDKDKIAALLKDLKSNDDTVRYEAITALAKHYSDKGADGFGLYESTLFTWCPDVRRTIREAGWNYKAPERNAGK